MRRSFALFLIAALLPLVITGAVLGTWALRNQRTAIEAQAVSHAQFSATLLERELSASMRAAQILAQSPAFDGPSIDEAQFRALTARLQSSEPMWRFINVTDVDGVRLFSQPEAPSRPSGTMSVDLASRRQAADQRRPVVSGMINPEARPAAFGVRAPVVRGEATLYIVSLIIDPGELSALLRAQNLPAGWDIEVIDGAGLVVAHSGAGPERYGKPADARALRVRASPAFGFYHTARNGQDAVGTWRPIKNAAGWSVHVALPAAAYNAPYAQASNVLIVGGLISLILTAALLLLLAREIKAHRLRENLALERHRLEQLGQMTGGVAHDFNNLLTPIIGGLDLIRRRLPDDKQAQRLIDGALVSAERARTLVIRLLAFARRQSLEPRDVNVTALLRGLVDLLERSAGPNVTVSLDIQDNLPAARVDPAQLELAVLNLAVNARDAMPDGGRLVISAAEERADKSRGGHLAPGRYVRISVTDTGCGMDAATLRRAIEPFFTTKDLGKGTGLGLSMVHGLAAQSGGALMLDSAPGKGLRADIWLPASGAAAPHAGAEAEALIDERVGRLMLVDDDDLVRASTAAVLRDHGHAVVEARSAFEALHLLRGGEVIDALVTDFAMPGKNGAQLIVEARAARPSLPALLITGFADYGDALPADVLKLGKPFRRVELLNMVARTLPAPARSDVA